MFPFGIYLILTPFLNPSPPLYRTLAFFLLVALLGSIANSPQGIIPPSAIKVKGQGQWKHQVPPSLEAADASSSSSSSALPLAKKSEMDVLSDEEEEAVDMKALKSGELEG